MLAGFAPVHASGDVERADSTTQLPTMSAEQKKQAQQYFASHSFEFSSIFKRHHPGPYWILEKTKEFQLSSEQIKQQEDLKIGKAQTHLALVVVPYHLKAYAALNPVQQTLYRKLAEKQQ